MAKMKTKKEKKSDEEESEGGMSLDDAFGDDEGVEYAESKPRKEKKKKSEEDEGDEQLAEDELDEELQEAEDAEAKMGSGEKRNITVKASKPIAKIKKGDKIKIDGREYEVDQHYVLMDHKTTKEMAIEIFDPKTDKDYQLRYFNDQANETLDLYELQEILFVKKAFSRIEW